VQECTSWTAVQECTSWTAAVRVRLDALPPAGSIGAVGRSMADPSGTHPSLTATLGTYLDLVDELAPGVVEGLYVVGSVALGDWHAEHSDIDIVAVTAEPATDEVAAQLLAAHQELRRRHATPDVDGPYLAWGDLVVEPATGLHRPWILDGTFHHDGDCFEINPVTWYTLATYGLAARGPSPERLEIALDVESRVRFVVDNLHSYWRVLGEQLAADLASRTFTTADFEWCVLGPLRLHYTAFTADVTSKRGAGEHGLAVTPARFHGAIRAALTVRSEGTDGPAPTAHMEASAMLIDWIVGDVTGAR
jgi:hypothetical protein